MKKVVSVLLCAVLLMTLACSASAGTLSEISKKAADIELTYDQDVVDRNLALIDSYYAIFESIREAENQTESNVETPEPSPAANEVSVSFDFSGLSFEELIELQRQVQLAIMESDGWQEVKVPMGIYEIGVDIPAGKWTISNGGSWAWITLSDDPSVFGPSISYSDMILDSSLDEGESVTWELPEGTYLWIEYGAVIFTPYTGASLGFKF